MPNYTNTYHFKKPLASENYDIAIQNGNMDLIDATFKEQALLLEEVEGKVQTVSCESIGAAPIESPTFTGTVSGITKAMVGLANVDNTSDLNKPISTLTQIALAAKAPLLSPVFNGDVTMSANLWLKGSANFGNKISFGDGDFVYLHEATNGVLTIKATTINLAGNVVGASRDLTATISTTWSGATAPFTQHVAVAGITAEMSPLVSPVYSTSNPTALLQKEAWACINKAVTYSGGVTFTCFEGKPTTAIPILIKVVN